LFAPAKLRPDLFALYAFNYEVAKIAESVSEPMLGQIRLQWWRERIEEIYAGKGTAPELVKLLALAARSHDLPKSLFDSFIDAREHDLEAAPFADLASLEAYADATSGNIMRLAARILGAGSALDSEAHEAGIAYALTGLLRSLPFHAARECVMLPADAMSKAGVLSESLFAGQISPGLTGLFARLAQTARSRHAAVHSLSRRFLPALLPAALVPNFADLLTRPGFNAFRDVAEIPVYRRQLTMLRAMARGRI
jgi:phytoene/squalene synthetase